MEAIRGASGNVVAKLDDGNVVEFARQDIITLAREAGMETCDRCPLQEIADRVEGSAVRLSIWHGTGQKHDLCSADCVRKTDEGYHGSGETVQSAVADLIRDMKAK